jgi:hypothetical protein
MYDSDDADSANGLHTVEMEIETTLLFDHRSQTTYDTAQIPRLGYLILTSFRS